MAELFLIIQLFIPRLHVSLACQTIGIWQAADRTYDSVSSTGIKPV